MTSPHLACPPSTSTLIGYLLSPCLSPTRQQALGVPRVARVAEVVRRHTFITSVWLGPNTVSREMWAWQGAGRGWPRARTGDKERRRKIHTKENPVSERGRESNEMGHEGNDYSLGNQK